MNLQKENSGRSMIEMLGVLAIIAVLTVGGIAGFSKAMERFKLNKLITEYSYFVSGMLEYLDTLKQTSAGMTAEKAQIIPIAEALNIIPAGWEKANNLQVFDSLGNIVQLWILENYQYGGNDTVLTFDIYLGGTSLSDSGSTVSANFSAKLCQELYLNFFIPLHAVVYNANLYKSGGNGIVLAGDKTCAEGARCLTNLSMSEINEICSSCLQGEETCGIAAHF